MTSAFSPGVGAVFSADIAVPDHERVRRFYGRVLSTGMTPLWRESDLTNNRGVPVIGIGGQSPEYPALPVHWMPHIQVRSVAHSVQRARALGGTVLMEHGEQWAVLRDPQGAAFGVIPVVPASALPPIDTSAGDGSAEAAPMGRIAWLDITVPEADALRDFYAEVIGWRVEPLAMQAGDDRYDDYVMRGDGDHAAGVCHARGPNVGLPPVWLLYLPVGDIAESLARVEAEGGRVIRSSRNKDGGIVYAAIEDPAGACVALVPA